MIDFKILRNQLVGCSSEKPYLLRLSNGLDLTILRLVREVADKRLVCQAEWNGQSVYVKFFFGKGAQRYAQRDKSGAEALIAANISTPKLLSIHSQDGCELLIFEAIANSQNLEFIWAHLSDSQRLSMACALAYAIGQHHHAGVMQTDLYFKNFLIAEHKIYTIDGDGVKQFKSIGFGRALHNFSVFLSKLDVIDIEAWLPQLQAAYAKANPRWSFSLKKLNCLSAYYRRKAASNYADKKVFRACTDVQVEQTYHSFFARSKAYQNLSLPEGIAACDNIMKSIPLLKNGNTCTVGLMKVDDIPLVIKRYNIKSIVHKIGRCFRKTRAEASWASTFRLQLLGVSTHKPMALIVQRLFFLRGKAFFLSEYIDAPDISEYFLLVNISQQRASAISHVVMLFYRLYLLNISHGDMKSTNIKMVNDAPVLIDLDSMRQHRIGYFAQKAHARDLKRFMQNWKADTSLYNAFKNEFERVYQNEAAKLLAKISI